jgi:cyanophycinase
MLASSNHGRGAFIVCPAQIPTGGRRGDIVPIGGGEDKIRDAAILRRFVALCGGRKARIVVIPTASRLRDSGRRYEEVFRGLRVADAVAITLDARADCDDARVLEQLEQATGVFLTGGNQLRLATTLGGTPVARLLRRRNAAGMPVAGTSAGAAFLCEHMIAAGDEGPTPRTDMVTLAPGLGLTNRVIIDQHFRQRDRLGRLLTALAFNPFAAGLGLDEDTAAFFGPDETIEVVGSGAITVVDPAQLEFSSMDAALAGQPVSLIGIKLHILIEGGSYNTHTRKAKAGAAAEAAVAP